MNTKSLRFRLTVWYAASLIIAIGVVFTSFYATAYRALYTQIDNTLISHSDRIVEVVTARATNMHDDIAKEAFVREFSRIPGMFVVIMNGSGAVVSSSQMVSPTDETLRDLFVRSTKIRNRLFTEKNIGTEKMRLFANPVYQNDALVGVVIMGHSVEAIQMALTNLISMLGIVFIIFLLPVIFGGYLNAKAATQPISLISQKLKRINSGNLNDRVENPGTGDEIEELSVTFNSLLDRLHAAFERERQFIGDVAHELKTPLSAQRANIEITLAKNRSREDLEQALREALTDNNELSSTLKNVLDLAWAQADSAKTTFTKVNASSLMGELKDLTLPMAAVKNIAVKGTLEPGIQVRGKRDKLFGALLNIVDNAITYTPSDGTITISLVKSGRLAKITIADTGIGIPRKDMEHIFERFYRGSRADKQTGSGLGLAIAKATITALGGTIGVRSRVGKGSEFTILLPRVSS